MAGASTEVGGTKSKESSITFKLTFKDKNPLLVQYIDLFGGKVYEEREKEDHEAVEEESKQG